MLESKADIRKSVILTCCRACIRMQYEFDITYSTWITCFLKMKCIVGIDLGCCVYFSIGSLTIFHFMGTAAPETKKERLEH